MIGVRNELAAGIHSDHDGGRAEEAASHTAIGLHRVQPDSGPASSPFVLLSPPIRFLPMGGVGQIYHMVGDIVNSSLGCFSPWAHRGGARVRTPVGLLSGCTDFYEVSGTNRSWGRLDDIDTRGHSSRYRV